MVLTAHQPVYLPWLGLFDKIAKADAFVSFNRVQYLPKDFNSRNRIKTANGPMWLTVPVHRHGHRERPLDEIEIDESQRWRRKHWMALQHAYGKAPHFDRYAPFFESVYDRPWQYLAELDDHLLLWLLEQLGIEVRFLRASDFDFEGRKSELVLDMCVELGADEYWFGALGRDYADVDAFRARGVTPRFQDYRHPVYPQLHGEFVSHLSVVDLLFNVGPASRDVILEGSSATSGR
jgi:WbqC-like protein